MSADKCGNGGLEQLATIPIIDVRDGGPVRHAREACDRARALRDSCIRSLPLASRLMMPLLDQGARHWLRRSKSPYIDEIGEIASVLGFAGVWLLNGSYQWSCTACARDQGSAPWLARTLDWPFPGLGRQVDVALMAGPAGMFYNVTWAGFVGVLHALAPGRFAACINQAPLRRRTRMGVLRCTDFAANGIETLLKVRAIPPDQLLRQAFENCRDYGEAKALLERTPLSRPVIYTLVGCAPGERCVIERTEQEARVFERDTAVANDWQVSVPFWEGRLGPNRLFKASSAEAAENSRLRRQALGNWDGEFGHGRFEWIVPPVLNRYTRLGVEMCPARGLLHVVGFEPVSGEDLPSPATMPREVGPWPAAA